MIIFFPGNEKYGLGFYREMNESLWNRSVLNNSKSTFMYRWLFEKDEIPLIYM